MYGNHWRTVLISGVITLIQSIVVAAFISTVLAGVSIVGAWTRDDQIFKASLALVLTPQMLAAPLIFMATRYKRVYILDAVGLLIVPLLIPHAIFHISQFAFGRLLNLQISSDMSAVFVVGGYAFLLLGLAHSVQAFTAYVERPYFGVWKVHSRKRRR